MLIFTVHLLSMITMRNISGILCYLIIFAFGLSPLPALAQSREVSLTIHLRGVAESKISLLALTPAHLFKPILEQEGVKNGETTTFRIPPDKLPGEFVIRFDYREKPSSSPYPSEKYIFIGAQDLELWVRPIYSNNADSTYFQPGETENKTWTAFSAENGLRREKLGVLHYFLMNYDDTGSKFYLQGVAEYDDRRKEYNAWLLKKVHDDRALFVSSLYRFHYVPEYDWTGSETVRLNNMIEHYFDGIDFDDTLMIRTSEIVQWMDNYVNLYGQQVTTAALRDSLFPLAGTRAIEKARQGHPRVYGWMVDYFYRGFETNGIDAGIKILEPYLNDPACLTSKRLEISRRLEGIKTLVPGSTAPDFTLSGPIHQNFKLSEYQPDTEYILLAFWSADCTHCMELINKLYPWQQQAGRKEKISVVAVSLDETDTELAEWRKIVPTLSAWTHLNAPEGVNSPVAYDYYVLATPVLILMDAQTKKIISLPGSLNELEETAFPLKH